MAANYWESTQRKHWTFTRAQIDEMRRKLDDADRPLISQYPLPDRRILNIYFSIRTPPTVAMPGG
jgi:cyclin C